MTIVTASTIFDCPREVFELISLYAGKDVWALRSTCRRFRDFSTRAFTAFTNRLFTQRYGTRAASEENTPLHIVVRRIKSGPALAFQLQIDPHRIACSNYLSTLNPLPSHLWLEIDEDGVPKLVNFNKRFFEKATSRDEILQARRESYSSSHKRDQELYSILAQQNKLALELGYTPLDSQYPLSDLRNRCRRLKTLQTERNTLLYAHQTNVNPGNLEKEFLCHYSNRSPFLGDRFFPLPLSYSTLNNFGVTLGEATFTHHDREHRVQVLGRFQFSHDPIVPAKIEFLLIQKIKHYPMGSFTIEKLWCKKRNYRILHISSFSTILDPRLGNRQLALILIQLAVEIFKSEAVQELEIVVPSFYDDEMDAAGFIQIDRNETGSTFSMEKSSSNPLTQFVSKDGFQEEPALLGRALTWESQIENTPILFLEEGPILPPLLFL